MLKNRIEKALVVGSGVMGSTIAQVYATGGAKVAVFDVEEKALNRALTLIKAGLETFVGLGKLTSEQAEAALNRISFHQDLASAAHGAQLAMEVVPEVPAIKQKVLGQLAEVCAADVVIASNTSALNIFEIVADIKNPERLVIAHFFAPAHIVPLVEVVPGPKTSAETLERTAEFLTRVGKSPVVMKKYGPGFIVNRIQKAIGETCLDMIEEGLADPAEIDNAVKLSLGVRLPIVGVVQTFDFQGLDMLLATQRNYGKVYAFIEKLVEQGRLGAKSAAGIYDYQGRNELEILRKRDELYLKMNDFLKEIHAFDPV
jgi:3-hydroxybutyryl-CoA dehydrogenase